MWLILSQGLLSVETKFSILRNSAYTNTKNLDYINCFETEEGGPMRELLDLTLEVME